MINLDANLENADWTKRTWDIIPIEPYLEALERATLTELRKLRALPSFAAAPPAVRQLVESRLKGL